MGLRAQSALNSVYSDQSQTTLRPFPPLSSGIPALAFLPFLFGYHQQHLTLVRCFTDIYEVLAHTLSQVLTATPGSSIIIVHGL